MGGYSMGPSGYSMGPSGFSMGPGPMHPPQETCSCCCITAIIFSIVAVIALIFGGLYFGGYIFADDNPDAFKCTSLKDIVTSTNAHNAKRAKLTEGTKKWKIREKEIERRYGSTNRRQKLCLLCM